jgi:hypothetical protein
MITIARAAEVDCVDGIQGAGFAIQKPEVKTTCRCGSSFSASRVVLRCVEGIMRLWIEGRSELYLGMYVVAWVVALLLTHTLSR